MIRIHSSYIHATKQKLPSQQCGGMVSQGSGDLAAFGLLYSGALYSLTQSSPFGSESRMQCLNTHEYKQLLLFSWQIVSSCLWLHELQHAKLSYPLLSPRVCSNSCPLSQWWYSIISSSVALFCPQSFPSSGSFPVSQFFASGGQSIGASASVLPMNIQDWFPLGLTGLVSLQSEGPSRVFSSTTIQKHQFFSIQPSLWSNCHIHIWRLEKP